MFRGNNSHYAVTMQFVSAKICKDMQKGEVIFLKNERICKDLQRYER